VLLDSITLASKKVPEFDGPLQICLLNILFALVFLHLATAIQHLTVNKISDTLFLHHGEIELQLAGHPFP
jgi:cytochrome b561